MVSQNNDGNYYEIAVDTAKEGAEVWSLNNWFKARVGDDGTPLVMRFYTQGQLNSFDGHQKPIIQGNVGPYSFDDQKQIVMAADAKVVSWTGDPSDMLPGGRVRYHFPQQMFPTEGAFYGFVGYVDESNGRRLTGVNVWFRVLGGVAQMGRACDYYINDLDIALANAKEKMRQQSADFNATLQVALQDLRDKYKAEVQANQDMSLQARQSLSELADTAGRISAQIKAQDIVTKAQFATELANNRSYADGKFGEMMDKIGDATPHFIASAAELSAKYPTGTTGLWVAQDDGNRYVWYNDAWTNFGAYQGQGIKDKYITNRMIADNTIQDTKISTVHLSSVQDSYLNVGAAVPWGGDQTNGGIVYNKDSVTWTKKNTKKSDAGVSFPVELPFVPVGNMAVYIDFVSYTSDSDALVDRVSLWMTQPNGTLIKQLWHGPKSRVSEKLVLTADDFAKNNYPKDFSLLFAVSGGTGTLTVKPRVSYSPDNIELSIRDYQLANLISTNHPTTGVWDPESWIDASKIRSSNENLLSKAVLWSGRKYDAINFNNGEVVKTSGDLSYNSGITVPIEADTNTDQYVQIVYGYHGLAKGVIGVSAYLGDAGGRVLKSFGAVKVADTACTLTTHITPEMFNQYNLQNNFSIVIGGQASAMFVKKIQVSSLPIERTLPTAISHLHNEIGEPVERHYGQNVNGIGTATKATVDGLTYGTTGVGYDGDNGRLKSIQAYVPSQGTYTFVAGKLDQHNLLVNGTSFTVGLSEGYNDVDMTSRNIQINNGDIVFMDLSKVGVYTPDGTHPKYLDSMLQDNSHPSTTPGYPGQMFYNAEYLVPFSYSVSSMNLPQQIEDLKAELATTQQQLNAAKAKKVNVISAPNGQSYRLIVTNDGSLSAAPTTPSNVTIFGNSLTYEHGKIGMAASDSNHDWYHYVTDYIKSKNPDAKINDRTNMSIWESATSTADREKVLNDSIKPLLSADTDLVIIQLGDNVNTPEKKATFAHDAGELIRQIRAVSPKAQVYWVYGWFGNYPEIFTPIQNACDGNGAIGIDIRDLNKSGNTSYVGATRTGLDGSTWKITNPGEAAHPSDKGMKAIADRVISNFDF